MPALPCDYFADESRFEGVSYHAGNVVISPGRHRLRIMLCRAPRILFDIVAANGRCAGVTSLESIDIYDESLS